MKTFQIVREKDNGRFTRGDLLTDGRHLCYTLELPWKDNLPSISCIPVGTYPVVIAWSNRFQQLMPRLIGVEGRSGILIHQGNTSHDTEGCILVGLDAVASGVAYSHLAFLLFMHWLGIALRSGKVDVSISLHGMNA